MPARVTVGVDTGGTFTDLVLADERGLRTHKLPSTPDDPSRAFLEGLVDLGVAEHSPFRAVHGTTVATNAILERKGARTAFVTTGGFRDLLAIGRQTRLQLYSLAPTKPEPLVAPRDCYEVNERVDPRGEVLQPLSMAEAERLVDRIARSGAEALAITLLFSFARPDHERLFGELAARRGLYVSLSSDVSPEHREYERASTTVINAFVGPIMARYLDRLEAQLSTRGCERLHVMQSNGGVISTPVAGRQPVRTLLSGPAGGVVGAVRLAAAAGETHVLTFDMGGTSTDVCLVRGEPPLSSGGEIRHLPVRVPMLDIHTIGAGGGSIARAAAGGALRVGPESAGAEPGPAAYGRGDQLTVTDANLVLGRLRPDSFLGGRMRLQPERSHEAFARLGASLALSPEAAADGVIRIANVQMARALRRVSVERGHDPRGYCLLPFGGGGPLHACELAELVGIRRLLVPPHPGLLSALGLLLSNIVKDYSRSVMLPTERAAGPELEQCFAALEEQALADMVAEAIPPEAITLHRTLDMRYRGQSYELSVPICGVRTGSPTPNAERPTPNAESLNAAFHARHAALYGRSSPDRATEVVQARLQAVGEMRKPALPREDVVPDRPPAAPAGSQRLWVRDWQEVPVHDRADLQPGHRLQGPALVVQEDTTTLITPGWQAVVDGGRNLILSS